MNTHLLTNSRAKRHTYTHYEEICRLTSLTKFTSIAPSAFIGASVSECMERVGVFFVNAVTYLCGFYRAIRLTLSLLKDVWSETVWNCESIMWDFCSTDHSSEFQYWCFVKNNASVNKENTFIALQDLRHFRDLQTYLFTQTKWMSVDSLCFRMWATGFQLSLHWKHFEPVVAVLGFAFIIVCFPSLLDRFPSNNFWYCKWILLGFCLRNLCTVAIAFFIPLINFLIYNCCT